jgi:hypothetical protein
VLGRPPCSAPVHPFYLERPAHLELKMDINSLLSPSESPAAETPPSRASPSPRSSPHKRSTGRPVVQERKSSGLSQQLTLDSPGSTEQSLPSLAAHNAVYQQQQQQGTYAHAIPSASYQQQSYGNAPLPTTSAMATPDSRAGTTLPPIHRQGSTPGMDTLAGTLRARGLTSSYDAPNKSSISTNTCPKANWLTSCVRSCIDATGAACRSSKLSWAARRHEVGFTYSRLRLSLKILTSNSFSLQNLPRSISARSSNDITMTDAPQSAPRVFVAKALSEADCNRLTELAHQLKENPFDFSAHITLIKLLRKGLSEHALIASDAHSYELLADLREARQTMNKIFPVGESLWADWLEDEKLLARTIDDRVHVMELFQYAVIDEPSSASLWRLYGDYMYYLWATAYDVADESLQADLWSDEDKEIGKEVFKWEPMMDVWEKGVNNTQRRLNDSHTVWDRYMEMLIQDQTKWPSPQKFQNIKAKFGARLATAHATSEQTASMFSTFISNFDNAKWNDTMVAMTDDKHIRQAKNIYLIREPHEFNILRAVSTGDEAAEWTAYSEYLDWELETQGVSSFPMINALYERATIRFPAYATLWNDYVEFLIGHPTKEVAVSTVVERATRHCPWSGDLWSQRLLTMEAEGKHYNHIETAKHDATASGLLDVGGLDELLKVYIAWCGCLRRRAFMPDATEDALDVAEVAIRSALEHVKKVAEQKDSNYAGDPHYRLERIYIKFLTQRGDVEAARVNWKALVPTQANSYDFWYRYYIWEMVMWAKFAMRANNEPETQLRTPEGGTAVLREALTYIATMDWPEQLVTMFMNHCEQHESVQELRRAGIEVRRATKIVTQRRQKEAAEATPAYSYQQAPQAGLEEAQAQTNGKRKRDSEASAEEGAVKKNKLPDAADAAVSPQIPSPPVRDREHAVILVKNVPSDASEGKVRHFFRDVSSL